MTVIDPCTHCGKSTAFGSGRFVDRIGYDDGWACAECMTIDEDIYTSSCDDPDCDCRRDISWPDNLPCYKGER